MRPIVIRSFKNLEQHLEVWFATEVKTQNIVTERTRDRYIEKLVRRLYVMQRVDLSLYLQAT